MLLFVFGVSLPMMTLTQFFVIDKPVSVLSGIWVSLDNRDYVMVAIIGIFTLLLPALKLLVLFLAFSQKAGSPLQRKLLHWMHEFGRWAMLDVFVVAVLLVGVKLGKFMQVELHNGLYFFAASVLIVMFLTHKANRLSNPNSLQSKHL